MPINEKSIQARLMRFAMDERNHILAAPNITNVFHWECDLLSLTRAFFSHEYEIKLTNGDYKREFEDKKWKHDSLLNRERYYSANVIYYRAIPNYYWFVSPLDIHVPDYAGWIRVNRLKNGRLDLWIEKPAPRLHNQKLGQKKIDAAYRVISYRLKDMWIDRFGGSNAQKEKA